MAKRKITWTEIPQETSGATSWPHERRCPECGKVFCIPVIDEWAYMDSGQPLCSWGCKRTREKREEDRQQRIRENRKNLTPRQREAMVRRLVIRGATDEEIQEHLGMSRQHVRYYRKKINEDWKG